MQEEQFDVVIVGAGWRCCKYELARLTDLARRMEWIDSSYNVFKIGSRS